MLIYLLRHGQTEYNAQKRYQGQRDIPLSAAGIAQLRQADFAPEVVYVTPLQRTAQTARVFFPGAKLIPVDGLKEMNFGRFEGQTFVQVEQDPEYLAWVQENEHAAHPDGERRSDFCNRVCKTLADLIDKALAEGQERLVIVAHGGTQMAALELFGVPRRTQMAAMERYALPRRDYYAWCGPNAGGYVLDARDWPEQHILHLVETVQYTKENG